MVGGATGRLCLSNSHAGSCYETTAVVAQVVELPFFVFKICQTAEKVIISLVGLALLDVVGQLFCEGPKGEELRLHVFQEGKSHLDPHIEFVCIDCKCLLKRYYLLCE